MKEAKRDIREEPELNLDPDKLKYNSDGLIPAIIQEKRTKTVLMMAYMNRESLQKTLETGLTWFWSRSRQKYWQKGETSGHVQKVKEVYYDCDADTLLLQVEQAGVACHRGNYSCFSYPPCGQGTAAGGEGEKKEAPLEFLGRLARVIRERKAQKPRGSYVAALMEQGEEAVARKIGEEALETVLAFMVSSRERLVEEGADLLFHLMLALEARSVPLEEVLEVLRARHEAHEAKE